MKLWSRKKKLKTAVLIKEKLRMMGLKKSKRKKELVIAKIPTQIPNG